MNWVQQNFSHKCAAILFVIYFYAIICDNDNAILFFWPFENIFIWITESSEFMMKNYKINQCVVKTEIVQRNYILYAYNTHHYSDFTWVSWHVKSLTTQQFVRKLVQANNEKAWKLHITSPLWGEPPVDSPHKGPVMGKHFHVLTQSCIYWSSWLVAHFLVGAKPLSE